MSKLLKRLILIPAFLLAVFGQQSVLAQTSGTVSGTITIEEDGSALAGANVVALDASGAIKGGSATGLDGKYSFTVPAGSYTIRARFVGFQDCEASVTVSSGGSNTVNCDLSQSGIELNTIVIAASRREEKVLDAPASISVLSGEDVAAVVAPNAVEALRTTPGVDMAQTGVDRQELVLRGFNNAFSGAAYVMTDYRQAAVPSLAANIYSIMGNIGPDIDHVEVVRGPGSALYGAGVDAGVVHFVTKDPFSHPGTTVTVMGGEQALFGVDFRHAGVFGPSGKIGYKVTGTFSQADDWELDANDPADAAQIASDGVRDTDYEKQNVNAALEYRFSDSGSLSANVGYANLKSTILSGVGTVQAEDYGYTYYQLRLKVDKFFAQVYVNKNNAGDSFVYGAFPVTDNSTQTVGQAQYDLSLAEGKQNIILGADFEFIRPDTEGTIQTDDGIDEFGAYVQSTTKINPKIDFTAALRGDYNSITDGLQVSPRAAIVYKPNNSSSFRATFNRAFSSPGTNSNFLNIVAGQIPGTSILIRGRGAADGYTWQRDASYAAFAGTDLVASSLNPAAIGAPQPIGLPLGSTYAAVYAGLAAIPNANLAAVLNGAGIPVTAAQAGALKALLSPSAGTNVQGFSQGILAKLNTSTLTVDPLSVRDLQDVSPLKQSITNTFEVGYKGVINEKLLVTVDVYYTQRNNFIGPLLTETPFVVVPNLATDLRTALAAGIAGNAQLAGTLALFGVTPAAASGLIVQLAGSGLPSASTPVAIVQPIENNGGVGTVPEIMLTYRNFGKVNFYGSDIAFQYMANDKLSVFGNLSIVSDDYFDDEETDSPGTGLEVSLNSPALKGTAGFKYKFTNGLSVNAAGRYTDGFPVLSGPYVGDVPSYMLVDIGAGFDLQRFTQGLRVDVGISNVTDNFHREFVGAPQMGRMAIARITYDM
ncbi:MAG: TonB-dependent receptor [Bacteroidetes bacterium]|nr:TonB-dependent receptor [Bacteroidota bacterium]